MFNLFNTILCQKKCKYGYYRYKYLVMVAAVILLIVLVQIFQTVGDHWAIASDKRLKK